MTITKAKKNFHFNLVEKNSFTVKKKNSKCRKNGIDRLRNGNLLRRNRANTASDSFVLIAGSFLLQFTKLVIGGCQKA